MKRKDDWQPRLTEFLSTMHDRDDCALAWSDAVAVMTGVDYAASYRGRYRTHAEGIALLRADGFDDHIDFVAQHFVEIAVSQARPGDLVVVEVKGDLPALGLVQGPSGCYVLTRGRVGLVPLSHATRAFEV